jgi:hypothetical protein
MGANKTPKKIAASLRSAGASDLARRLIEAFNLEAEIDTATASWLDNEVGAAVEEVRAYIPDEAYGEER